MDMDTKDKDLLIKKFVFENTHEIADNGFTESVMQKLPATHKSESYNWIVWLTGFIGLSVSLLFGIGTGWFDELLNWLINVPILYISFAVFCFPIVSSVWYFFFYERNFRII